MRLEDSSHFDRALDVIGTSASERIAPLAADPGVVSGVHAEGRPRTDIVIRPEIDPDQPLDLIDLDDLAISDLEALTLDVVELLPEQVRSEEHTSELQS